MHVLIYNPLHKGHHLNWARLLVEACAPLASRVTFATTSQSASSPEFQEHFRNGPAKFALDDAVEPIEQREGAFDGIRFARRAWTGLSAAVRRNRPDHVFLPDGDNVSLAPLVFPPGGMDLGLPASNLHALFVRGAYAYHRDLPWRSRLRSNARLLCLKHLPFGRLMFIDPLVHGWLIAHRPSLASRCILSPDPVSPVPRHEKVAARAALGIPVDGRLISCVGVLDGRKGVDEFVRSFADAPLGANDRLLLAGRAAPEVTAAVSAAGARLGPGRIISLNRILSTSELEFAISAADLVSVTYRFPAHIGSASILIRAAAAGRPVLASPQGWLGYVTDTHSLGWIYPEDASRRPAAIADSLTRAQRYTSGEQAENFAQFHSVDHFKNLMTAPLREHGNSRLSRVGSLIHAL